MTVRDEHLDWIVDQLSELGPVVVRRMFGGAGLYLDGRIFGIVDDDVVYFKVGDDTRDEYVSRGMEPFRPVPGGASMRYFEVPPDVLEDPPALAAWARKACSVGDAGRNRRAARLGKGRKSGR